MKYKAILDVVTLAFQDGEKYKHAKALVQNFGPHFCWDFPGFEKLYNDNEKTITIRGLKPEFVVAPLKKLYPMDDIELICEENTVDSESTTITFDSKGAYNVIKRNQARLYPENAEKGLSFFSVSFSDKEKRLTVDGLEQNYIKNRVKNILTDYGMESTFQDQGQELKCTTKLDYDYIPSHTMWILKYNTGERQLGRISELSKYQFDKNVNEIDTAAWDGQPEELKQFYKDYEYANYYMGRHDLSSIKDFYDEWIKNPDAFRPEKKPIIGKLSEVLEGIGSDTNLTIYNYDLESTGKHKAHIFKAIANMTEVFDFDVIGIAEEEINKVLKNLKNIK